MEKLELHGKHLVRLRKGTAQATGSCSAASHRGRCRLPHRPPHGTSPALGEPCHVHATRGGGTAVQPAPRCCSPKAPRWAHRSPDPADRTPSRRSCPSPGGQEGLPRSPGSRVPAAHGPVVLPGPSPGAVWRGLHKKGLSGARGRPHRGSQTCSGLDFPMQRPKSHYGQLVGWAAGRREENTRDRGAAGRQP